MDVIKSREIGPVVEEVRYKKVTIGLNRKIIATHTGEVVEERRGTSPVVRITAPNPVELTLDALQRFVDELHDAFSEEEAP